MHSLLPFRRGDILIAQTQPGAIAEWPNVPVKVSCRRCGAETSKVADPYDRDRLIRMGDVLSKYQCPQRGHPWYEYDYTKDPG